MKKCKYCGTELNGGSKFCPGCGKKQKMPKWLIVIIVLVVLGLFSQTANNDSSKESKSSSSSVSKQEKLYNIGDTITTDKYEITIISVKELTKVGGEYLNKQVSEGGTFVAVDWKYKNITNEPIGMFSFPSIKLLDSSDTKYSSDVDASSYYATETDPDRKIVSDLNPGITVTDSDVFEISADTYANGEWKILVDADKNYYVKIK